MLKILLQKGLLLFGSMLLFFTSFSQGRKVTGTVLDDKQTPLSGATISVKNAKVSTTTNASGIFSINVPVSGKTLVISYVGMQNQEVSIGNDNTVKISLTPIANTLNDIVVVGYGTRRRAEVTSSISSVNGRDIKNLPVAGADQALQGKVAGVTVNNNGGQPGGGVSVRVRGITSVNGNEPLYVVDGVIIPSTTNSFQFNLTAIGGGGGGQNANSVLATINPNDIESIDILKDASAQAIYGSQGANGVVLITTKHGKAGEGKINYDTYYGTQQIMKKLPMMDLSQFAQYQNDIQTEANQTLTPEFQDPKVLGTGTNWQDAIFQTGHIQNHQLSFSGGQNKTTYYVSGNYFDQTGILLNSTFKRYSLRANVDQQVKSWLKAGVSVNASKSDQRLTLADEQDGTITQALLMSPVIPIRDLNGNYGGQTNFGGVTYYQQINPIAQANARNNTSQQTKFFGNLYTDFTLTSYLTFRSEFDYNFQLTNNNAFQAAFSAGVNSFPSGAVQQVNNSLFWAWKNYLSFNKTFGGRHNISATAGHEAQFSHYEYIQGASLNLFTNEQVALSNGTGQPVTGAPFENSLESYFARAGYTYNDKYSLNLAFRGDAASTFGPNNKWGYFPAASIGWTATKEGFLNNLKTLNYLKLRVGAGIVGNRNAPSGAPQPPYTAGISTGLNGFGAGTFPKNVPNPDLKWEQVVTYNAGFDATLFNKKIDLTVDVYKKQTQDMLLFSSVPTFVGLGPVQPPIVNAGQMTNTGIDIGLTTYNITNKDFTWKTNFIFTHYKNKLDRLINANSSLNGNVVYGTITVTHTIPGYPVGSFYGATTDGLFTAKDAAGGLIPVQFGLQPATSASTAGTWAGDTKFKDISGPAGVPDGKIDNYDVGFIGSPHPKFTYGMTNTMSFKGVDVSIFLQGSYGAKIYNFLRRYLEGVENLYNNQLESALGRYTTANTTATIPRFTSANKNNTTISDRFVEDGSYLRIQNISVGYNIPKEYLRAIHVSTVRAYVSAQNLFTFTKYTGYDPEIGAYNQSITLMNVDNGHYPNPRSVTVGLNVEF